MKLHIADQLSLPIEAVTQTFAILAKRGSGKSYLASVMAEEMLKRNQTIIYLDPTGGAWGLRSGFPVAVLGGEHGDVALQETAGELIAQAVVENRFSAVIDLSLFRKGKMIAFMVDFLETLYRLNRHPVHLFVDEADAFAPQGRTFGGQENVMLGAMEDLVRRGRKRGIGCSLITQRPAVLNKNVLSQCESVFALRMVHPRDIGALKEWIDVHADETKSAEVIDSLPSLPIGDAWFWSPGWMDLLVRVQVRKRETFDSSATPKPGEAIRQPKTMAKLDLENLGQQIQATVETAKANDPKELKRRIAELEKKVRERPAAEPSEPVEIPVIKDEQIAAMKDIVAQIKKVAEDGNLTFKAFSSVGDAWQKAIDHITNRRATNQQPKILRAPPAKAPRPKPPATSDNGDSLTGPEQRIVDGLAWLESAGIAPATRVQTAFAARYSPSGSSFTNPLGALRTSGLVEYPGDGMVALTDDGRTRAAVPGPPATAEELQEMVFERLTGPEAKILRALIAAYPNSMTREDLGAASEYSPTGSSFTNPLGSLRSLGLVEYPTKGEARAKVILFLET